VGAAFPCGQLKAPVAEWAAYTDGVIDEGGGALARMKGWTSKHLVRGNALSHFSALDVPTMSWGLTQALRLHRSTGMSH
jgi:hypothetical protein